MKRITKLLLILLLLPTACQAEKCVEVIDDRGKLVENAKLKFLVVPERNKEEMGWSVTSLTPLYETNVGRIDENKRLCFNDYKKKDSMYLYKKMRQWVFYTDKLEKRYLHFDSIPPTVVLEIKEENIFYYGDNLLND